MAVGDDFQCIYSWRGADFRNIMDFPKRWADCQIIKLERNYRSVPEILDTANACIKGNPDQFQKTLRATREAANARPLIVFLRDASEQSQLVMRHIQRALHAGYAPSDIAVLYRSHFHVLELEMDLRRQRMDYTLTSGQGVFESVHIKDVIAYLRFCSGGTDMFAFQRMMSLLQGVGPKTAEKI
jgi:DNA helicase-2/ATP-dependent DNA helicase PcrA